METAKPVADLLAESSKYFPSQDMQFHIEVLLGDLIQPTATNFSICTIPKNVRRLTKRTENHRA